jgi:hypothetical protein
MMTVMITVPEMQKLTPPYAGVGFCISGTVIYEHRLPEPRSSAET